VRDTSTDEVLGPGTMEVNKVLHLKDRVLARVAAVPTSLPNTRLSYANFGRHKQSHMRRARVGSCGPGKLRTLMIGRTGLA